LYGVSVKCGHRLKWILVHFCELIG
jgi:hypothetical protein